jgi:hypothetical protein
VIDGAGASWLERLLVSGILRSVVTLFGPVLLTQLLCVVAHVVSLRSTHACRDLMFI